MTAPTLTEFLLARIADDEAEVAEWPHDGEWGQHPNGGMWVDPMGRPKYAPKSRILAECEAKRLAVDLHSGGHECPGVGQLWWDDRDEWTQPCPTLRYAALPFADHSDYREEWKP